MYNQGQNNQNIPGFGTQQYTDQVTEQGATQTGAAQFGGRGGAVGGTTIRGRDAAPDYRNPWKDINTIFDAAVKGAVTYDKNQQQDEFDKQQAELAALQTRAKEEEWTPEKFLTEKERVVTRHITENPLPRFKRQQVSQAADVAAKQWEMEQRKIEADEAAAARLDAQTQVDEFDTAILTDVVEPGLSGPDPLPGDLGGGNGDTPGVISKAPNILSGSLEEATAAVVDHALQRRYGSEFATFPPERQKRIRDIYTKQMSDEVLRRRRELRSMEETAAKKEADLAGTINLQENSVEFIDESADNFVGTDQRHLSQQSRDDIRAFIDAPGAHLRSEDKSMRAKQAAEMALQGILDGEGSLNEKLRNMETLIADPVWEQYFSEEDARALRRGLKAKANVAYVDRVEATSSAKSALVIEGRGDLLTQDDAVTFRDEQFDALGLKRDSEGKWILPEEGTPEYEAVARIAGKTATIRRAADAAAAKRAEMAESRDLTERFNEGQNLTPEEQALIFDNAPDAAGLRDMADGAYDFTDEKKVQQDLDSAVKLLNNPKSEVPEQMLTVIKNGLNSNDPAERKAALTLYSKLNKRHRDKVNEQVTDKYDRYVLREGATFYEANPGADWDTFRPMDRAVYDSATTSTGTPKGLSDDEQAGIATAISENIGSVMMPGEYDAAPADLDRAWRQYPGLYSDLQVRVAEYVAGGMEAGEAARVVMGEYADAGYKMIPDTDGTYKVVKDSHGHLDFVIDRSPGRQYDDEEDGMSRILRLQTNSSTPYAVAGRMLQEFELADENMSAEDRSKAAFELAKKHGLNGPPFQQGAMMRVMSFERLNKHFEEQGISYRLTSIDQIPDHNEWEYDVDLETDAAQAALTKRDLGAPMNFAFKIPMGDGGPMTIDSRILTDGPPAYLSQGRRGGVVKPTRRGNTLGDYVETRDSMKGYGLGDLIDDGLGLLGY